MVVTIWKKSYSERIREQSYQDEYVLVSATKNALYFTTNLIMQKRTFSLLHPFPSPLVSHHRKLKLLCSHTLFLLWQYRICSLKEKISCFNGRWCLHSKRNNIKRCYILFPVPFLSSDRNVWTKTAKYSTTNPTLPAVYKTYMINQTPYIPLVTRK